MTSNLGASERERARSASAPPTRRRARAPARHYVEQAEQFFRPEFFNRIDRVVASGRSTRRRCGGSRAASSGRLLAARGHHPPPAAASRSTTRSSTTLAARGFHPRYGARPLQREIERAVIQPLARRRRAAGPTRATRALHVPRQARSASSVEKATVSAADRGDALARRRRPPRRRSPAPDARRPSDARAGGRERRAPAGAVAAHGAERARRADEHAGVLGRQRRTRRRRWSGSTRSSVCSSVSTRSASRAEGLAEMARQRAAQPPAASPSSGRRSQRSRKGSRVAGSSSPAPLRGRVVRCRRSRDAGRGCRRMGRRTARDVLAWAARTGREATRESGSALAVSIKGPSTFELLRREAGLHRQVFADAEPQPARVTVSANGLPDAAGEDSVVVRVYTRRGGTSSSATRAPAPGSMRGGARLRPERRSGRCSGREPVPPRLPEGA